MDAVADFGEMQSDVLAFGGIVSNGHAFDAFRRLARARGVSARQIVSTGDVVAYCAAPAECVDALRALGAASIRGNCEESLSAGAGDCGCGFLPGSTCDRLSAAWYAHADARLDGAARAWLGGLPRLGVFRVHGRRWGVVHGGVALVNRFLWPTSPASDFAEEFADFERLAGPIDAILAGHCGLPFIREVSGRIWFNTGALGMPPNDGDPRTSFGVIGRQGLRIERLDYDHRSAAEEMRAVGLDQGYDRALETGWWPSEEVLPAEMRRSGG